MASNTNIFGIPTSSTSNNLDDLVNKALNETSYGIIDTSNDDSSNNELEEESNIFEELVDYTDPIVMFDPEVKKAVIVKSNEEQNTDGNITGAINEDRDSTKVEGIYYPIIKINNLLVNTLEELVDMTIELNSFYPTVKILVRDDNYKFLDDPPGMNNSGITVVCIPEFPEKYRKISLTFDIKSCFRVSDGTYDYMKYYGVYKMLFFEQNVLLGLSRDSLEEINKEIEENQQKQQEEEDNKDYKIIRIYGEEFKVDKNSPVTEKSDLNDICEAEIAYEEKHSESNSYSEMLDEISSLISSSLTNDTVQPISKMKKPETPKKEVVGNKLNTYEYLAIIAKMSGLGFACTDGCIDIEDYLPRLIQNQTYKEFIQSQLDISGLDEDSIFDVWIDPYGYMVLVNIAWLFNQLKTIKPSNLSIYSTVGASGTEVLMPKARVKKVNRMLTNFNDLEEMSDLKYSSEDYVISTNGFAIANGISETVITLELNSSENGGNNSIQNNDVISPENSVDGKYLPEYETHTNRETSINVDGYNTTLQNCIRSKFFNKYNQRVIEITLDKINYGLQRGTLVYVSYFTDDPVEKEKILSSTSNIVGERKIEKDNLEIDKDKIVEQASMILDYSKSGLFYINGMKYKYNGKYQSFIQELELIKVGDRSTYINGHTSARMDTNDEDKENEINAQDDNQSSQYQSEDIPIEQLAKNIVDFRIY